MNFPSTTLGWIVRNEHLSMGELEEVTFIWKCSKAGYLALCYGETATNITQKVEEPDET